MRSKFFPSQEPSQKGLEGFAYQSRDSQNKERKNEKTPPPERYAAADVGDEDDEDGCSDAACWKQARLSAACSRGIRDVSVKTRKFSDPIQCAKPAAARGRTMGELPKTSGSKKPT